MNAHAGSTMLAATRRFAPLVAVLLALLAGGRALRAEDWPRFRGPTGMGLSAERDLPTSWSAKSGENILWKVPLRPTVDGGKRDQNQSSPIVWRGSVIVCSTYWPEGTDTSEFPEQHVTCYRASDGEQSWDTRVPPGPWKLSDLRGGYGAPTPATDGERVYAAFGSATLAALDMKDGRLLWQHEIEDATSIDVAFATSPIVVGDLVVLLCDKNNKRSRITAYDRRSGALAWSRERPDVGFNHSTPVVVSIDGATQLLVAASNRLQGLDPTSGEVRWWCSTPGDVTSPISHDGLVYTDSGRGGPGIAVDPSGSGDVTKTHIRWKVDHIPEGLSSPVVAGGLLYRTHNPAIVKCFRWKDGEVVFNERLEGMVPQASPFVTADALVYFASGGTSYVVRPGETLDIVSVNDLGDPSPASAAVSGGRIFIKGSRHLYCVGVK